MQFPSFLTKLKIRCIALTLQRFKNDQYTFFVERFFCVRAEFYQMCQVLIGGTEVSRVFCAISLFCRCLKLIGIHWTLVYWIYVKSVGVCLLLKRNYRIIKQQQRFCFVFVFFFCFFNSWISTSYYKIYHTPF